jgi:hypothetical protein
MDYPRFRFSGMYVLRSPCRYVADISGFQSLLQAIEAEDTEGRIEIHIYLTAKIEYVSLPKPCPRFLNCFSTERF